MPPNITNPCWYTMETVVGMYIDLLCGTCYWYLHQLVVAWFEIGNRLEARFGKQLALHTRKQYCSHG